MRLKLLVRFRIGGRESTEFIDIHSDPCLIGRKEANLKIPDRGCSRQHAMIYINRGGFLALRDLNSTNGTQVNGDKVFECQLNVGDEIGIASTSIVVVDFQLSSEKTLVAELPLEKEEEVHHSETMVVNSGNWQGLFCGEP